MFGCPIFYLLTLPGSTAEAFQPPKGEALSFWSLKSPALLIYPTFLSLMELETKAKRPCSSKEPKYRTGVGKMGTGKGVFVSK